MCLSVEYLFHELDEVIIGEAILRFILEIVKGILEITEGCRIVVRIDISSVTLIAMLSPSASLKNAASSISRLPNLKRDMIPWRTPWNIVYLFDWGRVHQNL